MTIYFLQGELSKNWKIGFTSQEDPLNRIKEIKKRNKFETIKLKGLLLGDFQKEKKLHNKFSHFKLDKGEEYFENSSDIRNFVDEHTITLQEYKNIIKERRYEERLNYIKKNLDMLLKDLSKDKKPFENKPPLHHFVQKASKKGVDNLKEHEIKKIEEAIKHKKHKKENKQYILNTLYSTISPADLAYLAYYKYAENRNPSNHKAYIKPFKKFLLQKQNPQYSEIAKNAHAVDLIIEKYNRKNLLSHKHLSELVKKYYLKETIDKWYSLQDPNFHISNLLPQQFSLKEPSYISSPITVDNIFNFIRDLYYRYQSQISKQIGEEFTPRIGDNILMLLKHLEDLNLSRIIIFILLRKIYDLKKENKILKDARDDIIYSLKSVIDKINSQGKISLSKLKVSLKTGDDKIKFNETFFNLIDDLFEKEHLINRLGDKIKFKQDKNGKLISPFYNYQKRIKHKVINQLIELLNITKSKGNPKTILSGHILRNLNYKRKNS
jgi:hypothetical protein